MELELDYRSAYVFVVPQEPFWESCIVSVLQSTMLSRPSKAHENYALD